MTGVSTPSFWSGVEIGLSVAVMVASRVCVLDRVHFLVCMTGNFGDLSSALIIQRTGSGISDVRVLSGPLCVARGSPINPYGCRRRAVLVHERWLGSCSATWLYCWRRN